MNPITLQLSLDQVNLILSSLIKLPYDQVAQLINDIQIQANPQLNQAPQETETQPEA